MILHFFINQQYGVLILNNDSLIKERRWEDNKKIVFSHEILNWDERKIKRIKMYFFIIFNIFIKETLELKNVSSHEEAYQPKIM